jgi:hypothetical protein
MGCGWRSGKFDALLLAGLLQWPQRSVTMRIKVQDGTPIESERSLCTTCRCSTIVRGRTLDEELVLCSALGLRSVQITFKVTSCSDYADQRIPSYMEMMQDAWILRPGSKRRPAGFVRASDLKEEEIADDFYPSVTGKRGQ